jgi:hypothetical protein
VLVSAPASGIGATQTEASHVPPAAQALVHEPQWLGSVVRSTQSLPQIVWAQGTHALLTHTLPLEHALPQPLQLLRSVEMSTQLLLQMREVGPLHTQVPWLQTAAMGHARSQAPQLSWSDWRSLQVAPPLQSVSPAAQTLALAAQLAPVGQRVKHLPQLFGSRVVSTHAVPAHATQVGSTVDVSAVPVPVPAEPDEPVLPVVPALPEDPEV